MTAGASFFTIRLSRIALGFLSVFLPAVVGWADDALPVADAAFHELETLHISYGNHSEAVQNIVAKAEQEFEKADSHLAEELQNLPPLPQKPRPSTSAQKAYDQQVRKLRTQRCLLAWRKGKLYARAAMAVPQKSPMRKEYLQRARQTFGALRLDYVDLPLSMVGYLEEARLLRQVGQLEAAGTLLEPVLALTKLTPKMKQNDPRCELIAELTREARIESLELILSDNPSEVFHEARTYRNSKELADNPLQQSRCDWILIRAHLATASDKAPSNTLALAKMLRQESLAKTVGMYDRLEVLKALDTYRGNVMTKSEQLAWADLRVQGQWPDAIELYAQAWKMTGPPFSEEQLARYLYLLQRQSKRNDARIVSVCDEWLRRLKAEDKKRGGLLSLRSGALVSLFRASKEDSPNSDLLREKTLSALQDTFSSTIPEKAARIDALRQWVTLRNSNGMQADNILKTLADESIIQLVDDDPFLLFSQAAARHQKLSGIQSEHREAEIQTILGVLKRANELAGKINDSNLQAYIALLHGQVLASGTQKDWEEALEDLELDWERLRQEKDLLVEALKLRFTLLVKLGQVTTAGKVLDELDQNGTEGKAEAILQLAEILTRRYRDIANKTELQSQIIGLCERVQGAAMKEKTNTDFLLQRTAEILLDVQAYADAERILNRLLHDSKREKKSDLSRRLLLARVKLGSGRKSEGLSELKNLTEHFPDSAQVQLAVGECELQLRNPDVAATAFRAARKVSPPGGCLWCQASLGLTRALQQQGHLQAAREVLRVASVLYPDFGTPELRAEQIQLQESLQAIREATVSDTATTRSGESKQ